MLRKLDCNPRFEQLEGRLLLSADPVLAWAGSYYPGGDTEWSWVVPDFNVVTADFNGDGAQDIAVSNYGGSVAGDRGNVAVLLSNGDGTFADVVTFSPGAGYPRAIAVGDFNNDGRQDIAVANAAYGQVNVLLGDGNGGFPNAVASAAGISARDMAVGDFNGDGMQDLAIVSGN